MTEKLTVLETTLEAMLAEDETISARSVVRRLNGLLKHASDVTRNEKRRTLVEGYAKRQDEIRAAIERTSKTSRIKLQQQLALKNQEIERLRSERELLIASHRAMILAVAENGGFSAWKRFFHPYQATLDLLSSMQAVPKGKQLDLGR